jgi:CelD/BcsL family acetyltransferase involved in cellulose biosynthesis
MYWKRISDKAICIGDKQYLPVFLRMRLNPTIMALKKLSNVYYSIIYIDNTIAGFSAGFISPKGKIILPYLSINSTFARYSPGGILITETIKCLSENHNYKYFDLSRGAEKYKYTYGGIEHFNFNYEIYTEATAMSGSR